MGRYTWIIILLVVGINMILRVIAKRAEAAAKAKAAQSRIDATLTGPRAPTASQQPSMTTSSLERGNASLEVPRSSPRPMAPAPRGPSGAPAPASMRRPRSAEQPVVRRSAGNAPSPPPRVNPSRPSSASAPPRPTVIRPLPTAAPRQGGVMRPLPVARAVTPPAIQAPASTDRLKRKLSQAHGTRTIDQPLLHSKPAISSAATQKAGQVTTASVARAFSNHRDLRLAFVMSEILGRPKGERPVISHNPA